MSSSIPQPSDHAGHSFIHVPDPSNLHDHTTVVVRTDAEELSQVLEAFEAYLRATGYHFDGFVTIIDLDEDGCCGECGGGGDDDEINPLKDGAN